MHGVETVMMVGKESKMAIYAWPSIVAHACNMF